ncbi:MAG: hypothetical protein CUN56_15175, partial [Phototrophicales bacterium]
MSDEQIEIYYNRGKEQNRLFNASGKLERIRTQELLLRYLPDPPAEIADIGGGTGIYSRWLAEKGYPVHLRDIVPLHIEVEKCGATYYRRADMATPLRIPQYL